MKLKPHIPPRWNLFFLLPLFIFTLTFSPMGDPSSRNSQAAPLSRNILTIELFGPPVMGAVSFIIEYNNQIVTFESVTAAGSASGAMVMPNSKPEKGWVKIGLIKADGFSPGTVMTLTFQVIGSGAPDTEAFQMSALDVKDLSGRTVQTDQVLMSVTAGP
jgi:hypothetical protein